MRQDEPESPRMKEAAITAVLLGLAAVLLSVIGVPFHQSTTINGSSQTNTVVKQVANK